VPVKSFARRRRVLQGKEWLASIRGPGAAKANDKWPEPTAANLKEQAATAPSRISRVMDRNPIANPHSKAQHEEARLMDGLALFMLGPALVRLLSLSAGAGMD
jgi:hypothetical protein